MSGLSGVEVIIYPDAVGILLLTEKLKSIKFLLLRYVYLPVVRCMTSLPCQIWYAATCSLLSENRLWVSLGKPSMLVTHPSELGHCGISVFSLTNKEKQLKKVDSLAFKCCSLDPDSALIMETFSLCLLTWWVSIANWVEIDIKRWHCFITLLYAFTLKPIFIYIWIQISSKAWLGIWLGISFRSMLITVWMLEQCVASTWQ